MRTSGVDIEESNPVKTVKNLAENIFYLFLNGELRTYKHQKTGDWLEAGKTFLIKIMRLLDGQISPEYLTKLSILQDDFQWIYDHYLNTRYINEDQLKLLDFQSKLRESALERFS